MPFYWSSFDLNTFIRGVITLERPYIANYNRIESPKTKKNSQKLNKIIPNTARSCILIVVIHEQFEVPDNKTLTSFEMCQLPDLEI